MTGFQKLCIVTCVIIFGLIILGGVVRATDSGLGCPDWPRCHGSFIPKWEKHTLIEYSHRLTASIAGLLVLSVVVVAGRSYRRVPAILYPSIAALALLLVQAGLGGAAVLNDLPPEVVAVHLGTAITILTLLLIITTAAFAVTKPMERLHASRQFGRLSLLALALTLPLMLIGSYVSGADYGLACNGWPLCNGEVFPSADAASVQIHFMHRLLAAVLGAVLLALAWVGWRHRRSVPFVTAFSLLALGVYVIQAMLGAANVWTELSGEVSGAHLAFATLLWCVLAVLNIRVHRLHQLLPLAPRPSRRSDLAGASS
ncbi:MAG: hypothetical protein GEU75_09760 [Dehalococcoidia bacterium]|nr:hypothetical protein [Dehalococcoidia bacterium]